MPKAYLNALAEEGTRQDLIDWLVKLDVENDRLRAALRANGLRAGFTETEIDAVLKAVCQ